MKVSTNTNLANVSGKEFERFSSLLTSNIADAINGNLTLEDNIKGQILSCVFPSANVQVAFSHKLGKLPIGYIKLSSNVSADVSDGGTANTTNTIYLKCTAAATVKLFVL